MTVLAPFQKRLETLDLQENGIPWSTRKWKPMIYKKMEIHDLQENEIP
jgi:hypothetical protein